MKMQKGMDKAKEKANAAAGAGLGKATMMHARNQERKLAGTAKQGVGMGKGKGMVNRGKRGV